MQVETVACWRDNYAYLIVDGRGRCAIVDPTDAVPVAEAIDRLGVSPAAILCTHHHPDHVAGIDDLRARWPDLPIHGHGHDRERIGGLSVAHAHGDRFSVGALELEVLHVPGHTLGAVTYLAAETTSARWAFTGDTLFLAGCGRLFEGTAAQMSASLDLLAALPDDTRIACGHEYTVGNLHFARHVEPNNRAIVDRLAEAEAARAARRPTVPGTIAVERATNPFLRASSEEIRARFPGDRVEAFAALRRSKDEFRG
jgi:hydroxyacylglutathione hydrolase